ncbi:MAG: ArsR family transcriptional regulator, arsenate/arsenite/antimonite-responsive transcriptional [Chthoniobacter sp.]|nr:ArsR family transcriptional regulator, arsenate/arsenite/antimonite-responsive transcriptional [Chthoniobacter sp.]
MDLIKIYQCLSDRTRLRILHLLSRGPLCVCHFQELLDEPQVKISKHLGYLKEKGLVVAQRHQNWMIYALPANPAPVLEANLQCLEDCPDPVFTADLHRLSTIRTKLRWIDGISTCASRGSRRREPTTQRATRRPALAGGSRQ